MGGGSSWTRPSAPECGDTIRALAGDQGPIYGGDRPRRRLQGRYRLGHRPVVLLRTETAQCTVRATLGQERCCGPLSGRCRPWSWTLKKCCGKRMGQLKSDSTESLLRVERWWCASKATGEPVRSPKIISLWQTIISFVLLHSSCMWIQTVLPCGKHCQTMQTGTVSRLRFCKISWGFKINIRWNIVHFWKSYVCSNQLDV